MVENVLVPKFKEFAIWLAAEASRQPLELNSCPRLTQNLVLQTKYFVIHDEMEKECSLNNRKLCKVH